MDECQTAEIIGRFSCIIFQEILKCVVLLITIFKLHNYWISTQALLLCFWVINFFFQSSDPQRVTSLEDINQPVAFLFPKGHDGYVRPCCTNLCVCIQVAESYSDSIWVNLFYIGIWNVLWPSENIGYRLLFVFVIAYSLLPIHHRS